MTSLSHESIMLDNIEMLEDGRFCVKVGRITAVYDFSVDIELSNLETATGVEVFYHCQNSEVASMGADIFVVNDDIIYYEIRDFDGVVVERKVFGFQSKLVYCEKWILEIVLTVTGESVSWSILWDIKANSLISGAVLTSTLDTWKASENTELFDNTTYPSLVGQGDTGQIYDIQDDEYDVLKSETYTYWHDAWESVMLNDVVSTYFDDHAISNFETLSESGAGCSLECEENVVVICDRLNTHVETDEMHTEFEEGSYIRKASQALSDGVTNSCIYSRTIVTNYQAECAFHEFSFLFVKQYTKRINRTVTLSWEATQSYRGHSYTLDQTNVRDRRLGRNQPTISYCGGDKGYVDAGYSATSHFTQWTMYLEPAFTHEAIISGDIVETCSDEKTTIDYTGITTNLKLTSYIFNETLVDLTSSYSVSHTEDWHIQYNGTKGGVNQDYETAIGYVGGYSGYKFRIFYAEDIDRRFYTQAVAHRTVTTTLNFDDDVETTNTRVFGLTEAVVRLGYSHNGTGIQGEYTRVPLLETSIMDEIVAWSNLEFDNSSAGAKPIIEIVMWSTASFEWIMEVKLSLDGVIGQKSWMWNYETDTAVTVISNSISYSVYPVDSTLLEDWRLNNGVYWLSGSNYSEDLGQDKSIGGDLYVDGDIESMTYWNDPDGGHYMASRVEVTDTVSEVETLPAGCSEDCSADPATAQEPELVCEREIAHTRQFGRGTRYLAGDGWNYQYLSFMNDGITYSNQCNVSHYGNYQTKCEDPINDFFRTGVLETILEFSYSFYNSYRGFGGAGGNADNGQTATMGKNLFTLTYCGGDKELEVHGDTATTKFRSYNATASPRFEHNVTLTGTYSKLNESFDMTPAGTETWEQTLNLVLTNEIFGELLNLDSTITEYLSFWEVGLEGDETLRETCTGYVGGYSGAYLAYYEPVSSLKFYATLITMQDARVRFYRNNNIVDEESSYKKFTNPSMQCRFGIVDERFGGPDEYIRNETIEKLVEDTSLAIFNSLGYGSDDSSAGKRILINFNMFKTTE